MTTLTTRAIALVLAIAATAGTLFAASGIATQEYAAAERQAVLQANDLSAPALLAGGRRPLAG